MKENSKNSNLPKSEKGENQDDTVLKEWKAPTLQIENTNNTLGGTLSCNAPGDDTWYVS